jgi:hypothetical protein
VRHELRHTGVDGVQERAVEGRRDRLAGLALEDEAALRLDDFPFAIEEELLLRLEVVEDRRDGDVRCGCHLRHGHVVKAALDEHFRGDVGDREAGLGLLALAKAGALGGHRTSS